MDFSVYCQYRFCCFCVLDDMTFCALYARVSTHKQDEMLQLPRLRDAARLRDLDVWKEYSDEASGKDSNRPGWIELKKDARAGRFRVLLVVKLDRIMRSLPALYTDLTELSASGVTVVCLDQGTLDLASPQGKLIISVMGAVAEWERDIISDRTKAALEAKRAQGVKLGRPKSDFPTRRAALLRKSG